MESKLINITRDGFIKKIPSEDGVYKFIDKNKKVLYVGKSVNLRSRISSYFTTRILPKTKKMVSSSKYVSFIITRNEFESLILEAELIKKEKPKYNVIQKDDKSPLYIKITKEEFPRVVLCRKTEMKKDKRSLYFGPYLSTKDVKSVIRTIRKFIPFSDHKPEKKPCFYSQIGLCNPCPSLIKKTTDQQTKKRLRSVYLRNISRVKNILKGNILFVKKRLDKELKNLVEEERYEEAKELSKRLDFFEKILQRKTEPQEYLENPNLVVDIREKEVESLQNFLKNYYKIKKLKRIECFDISHISGKNVVGSMVVFLDGDKRPSLYRKFKIKNPKNDDFSSIREVIQRRLNHLRDWGTPDLIIIDGGKPQLIALLDILRGEKIPFVGIAKKEEEIVIPVVENNGLGFVRKKIKEEDFGNLIIRIRDESHRFAHKYYRLLQGKIKNA